MRRYSMHAQRTPCQTRYRHLLAGWLAGWLARALAPSWQQLHREPTHTVALA